MSLYQKKRHICLLIAALMLLTTVSYAAGKPVGADASMRQSINDKSIGADVSKRQSINDSPVIQRQFGKQTVTLALGDELIYYDYKQNKGWDDSYLNNTQSLTVFRPSTAGAVIQVVFEQFDVQSDGDGWPGYVNIYNGDPDEGNTFQWATDVFGVTDNPVMPTGNILEVLDGKYTDKTLTATSADGVLSVGMLWKRGKASTGWKATVRCIRPQTMSVTGAATSYDDLDRHPRTKNNILLANFSITTEGEENADRLKAIDITLPLNEGVLDPNAIHVYTKLSPDADGAVHKLTSVSQQGDGFRITLDHELEKGVNTFAIVGNLRDDGTIGGQVSLDITRLITDRLPDGISPFDRQSPVSVYCPGIVLISKADTVEVGDYPIDFFDDGGLDNDATPYFDGFITFVPKDKTKKVRIDFSKVRLFTSAQYSTYGQYLKVYNGMDTTAANLLTEVKHYQTPTVRSSSDDGALTVGFHCTVSATNEGWEAKVVQETPPTMTVDTIRVSQVVNETVNPGDTNQGILYWNIKTEGNGQALTADRFTFTTEGSDAPVVGASLYYTRMNDEFDTLRCLGHTDINATSFTINATDRVPLLEGDNYFWLTYDIGSDAVNGQRIDACLTGMTLSGEQRTVSNGNPNGNRMVKHTILSHEGQGTVRTVVDGEAVFKNKMFLDKLDYYEFGEDDRINIFVPKHSDRALQIDFSRFVLYWSSNPDEPAASFSIYSGEGTGGELLWQLTTAADKEVGPGRVLNSTSPNGALTVVFNSNAKKFVNTANGFEAIVREVDLSAPTVKTEDITTTQGSSVTLTATVEGGTPPYSIEWTNGKHETVGTTITPTECDDYYVRVTDSRGKTAVDTCRVIATGEAHTATFENLYLAPESYWQGSSKKGSFVSGTWMFDNGYVPEWNYWHGFAYANTTSTAFNGLSDQFHSAVGHGVNGSDNYAIGYPQDGCIYPLNNSSDKVSGFYVSNTAYVVHALLHGDGITAGGFRKGDFLRLTAIGKQPSGAEQRIDFFLADYRGDNEADWYYLDTWQWFDLSALGNVEEISFEMGSTRGNLYGMTTPSYFCMDDFNGQPNFTDLTIANTSEAIPLADRFTFEHPTATVSYSLLPTLGSTGSNRGDVPSGVWISEDGTLHPAGNTDFSVLIRATQRGKQQFIRLIMGSPTGIKTVDELTSKQVDKSAYYTLDGQRLTSQPTQKGVYIHNGRKIVIN